MINEIDINRLYKQTQELIESLPAKNLVLRNAALADLKKSLHSCLMYWAHQNNASQLEGDAPETEGQRIERIVAPYIGSDAAGKKTLFGKSYPADIPMGAKIAALQKIAETEAKKQMGMQQQTAAEGTGTEEKKTIAQPIKTAAPLPSTSDDSSAAMLRPLADLFANSTVMGSAFGERVLGTDKGATTAQAADKAIETIHQTTSVDSLIRGGNQIEPHVAICLGFVLRVIDESEINLANDTGLTAAGKGRKFEALTKHVVIRRVVEAVRPELLQMAEEKKAKKKAENK